MMPKNQLLNIKFWTLVSLTLGLMPFEPEPHIWGKLKWISGGAVGMRMIDWFDVLLHGLPWAMLFISLGVFISNKIEQTV